MYLRHYWYKVIPVCHSIWSTISSVLVYYWFLNVKTTVDQNHTKTVSKTHVPSKRKNTGSDDITTLPVYRYWNVDASICINDAGHIYPVSYDQSRDNIATILQCKDTSTKFNIDSHCVTIHVPTDHQAVIRIGIDVSSDRALRVFASPCSTVYISIPSECPCIIQLLAIGHNANIYVVPPCFGPIVVTFVELQPTILSLLQREIVNLLGTMGVCMGGRVVHQLTTRNIGNCRYNYVPVPLYGNTHMTQLSHHVMDTCTDLRRQMCCMLDGLKDRFQDDSISCSIDMLRHIDKRIKELEEVRTQLQELQTVIEKLGYVPSISSSLELDLLSLLSCGAVEKYDISVPL